MINITISFIEFKKEILAMFRTKILMIYWISSVILETVFNKSPARLLAVLTMEIAIEVPHLKIKSILPILSGKSNEFSTSTAVRIRKDSKHDVLVSSFDLREFHNFSKDDFPYNFSCDVLIIDEVTQGRKYDRVSAKHP
jgi:hypothetical protein